VTNCDPTTSSSAKKWVTFQQTQNASLCPRGIPYRLIAALAYSDQAGSEGQLAQGACPTLTFLLRRTIRDHLRRSRPEKILNVFQRIRLRFFHACSLASGRTSLASSRTAMSDRLLGKPRSNMITGKQGPTPMAHASPHGCEAVVGAGAPTTTPLSRRQRAAQSNPAWGRPQGRVQGAIDRAVAA
jgi:hypothetical protein